MGPMRALLSLGALMLTLAGCATVNAPYADDAAVAAVSYRDPGPPSLTLYTMVRNSTGSGGHSAILINASERIMFDPAGSFSLVGVPERNDVLFGITPQIEKIYRSAHARSTYHVLMQRVELTPEQAEIAYRLALNNGAVPKAFCTDATSRLLQRVPGFEGIKYTLFPTKLAKQFGTFPGVTSERYYEDDDGNLDLALAAANKAALGY